MKEMDSNNDFHPALDAVCDLCSGIKEQIYFGKVTDGEESDEEIILLSDNI